MLPKIFDRAGTLKVVEKLTDGHPIHAGHVYIAPPDVHLLVEHGRLRLVRGPKENRHRPAIDPLFRSAAYSYGARVIGVILSGNLDDGASGLAAIKERGGISIVQDPAEAPFPEMPRNALKERRADYCLPVEQISPLLIRLVNEKARNHKKRAVSDRLEIENFIAEMKPPSIDDMKVLGKPVELSCPDCNGALWEIKEGKNIRYRCRVGHAFSMENLESGQAEQVEAALWAAVRSLEERATILRRLATEARKGKRPLAAQVFEKKYRDMEPAAQIIRNLLAKTPR